MEISLINVNVPYNRVTSTQFSELSPCCFLNNNQSKIIFFKKNNLYTKVAYFGVTNSAAFQLEYMYVSTGIEWFRLQRISKVQKQDSRRGHHGSKCPAYGGGRIKDLKVGNGFCPHKNKHTDVYSSFIHNCQDLEATKIPSVGEWIMKLVGLDNGI